MPNLDHLSKQVGYQIHTNRELGLMLRGEKPLAMFADYEGFFPNLVLRYLRMFDRHVLAGRFLKHVYREAAEIRGEMQTLVRIYYMLPGQEWRAEEMNALRRASPWTLEHERREGELLGYTDEQNDIWAKRLPK